MPCQDDSGSRKALPCASGGWPSKGTWARRRGGGYCRGGQEKAGGHLTVCSRRGRTQTSLKVTTRRWGLRAAALGTGRKERRHSAVHRVHSNHTASPARNNQAIPDSPLPLSLCMARYHLETRARTVEPAARPEGGRAGGCTRGGTKSALAGCSGGHIWSIIYTASFGTARLPRGRRRVVWPSQER